MCGTSVSFFLVVLLLQFSSLSLYCYSADSEYGVFSNGPPPRVYYIAHVEATSVIDNLSLSCRTTIIS